VPLAVDDSAGLLARLDAAEGRLDVIEAQPPSGASWTHEDITSKLQFRFKNDASSPYIGTGPDAVYSAGLHRLGNMQYIDLYVSFGDRVFTEVYAEGAPRGGTKDWGWVFVPTEERLRPMVGGLGNVEIYRNLANEGRGLGWCAWNRFGPQNEWGLFPFYVDVGFTNATFSFLWPDIGGTFWKTQGTHFRLITNLYQARA
jgi:hypothetical protein